MTNDELKQKIGEQFSSASFEDPADPKSSWLSANIDASDWPNLSTFLRKNESFQFDYLFCLTCIDWKTHLMMVYHLSSTVFRHTMVVKSKLELANPSIESCCHIWRTAEFHEREVYEMFGVNFLNHPDLRLLILPDGWENRNPMRKDFEDPINMIRL